MSEAKRNGGGYVWVTWITKLLAGEDKCWWKSWKKSRFKYEKRPETQERKEFLAEWTETHDGMVRAKAARFKAAGAIVRMEDEGEFKLKGSAGAMLAGKPDLVVLIGSEGAEVHDEKSGKARESDKWQVRIYMIALPLTWLGKAIKLRGFVGYRDGDVEVPSPTAEQREAIFAALRKVTGDVEPDRAPSAWECKFCDVSRCPDRVGETAPGTTQEF